MLQAVVSQLSKEIALRESQVSDLKRALAILTGGVTPSVNGDARSASYAGRMQSSDVYLALKANPDGVRILDMAGDLKKPYANVASAVSRLRRRGFAESMGNGLWRATNQGEASPIVTPAPVADRGPYKSKGGKKRAAIAQYLQQHPEGSAPEAIRNELGIKPKTVGSSLQYFRRKGLAKSIQQGQWIWLGDGTAKTEMETARPVRHGIGVGKPAPVQDQVYAVVQRHPEGIRSRDIAQEAGVDLRSVATSLTPIKNKGLIRNQDMLWFPITQAVGSTGKKQPSGMVNSKIYRAVLDHPEGVGSINLANELGMGKNTVSSFLSQLCQKGYLRHENSLYFPN